MSFYLIADTKYSDGTYFVDPDIGIFDEEGIEEAKRFLYEKCKEKLQEDFDRNKFYFQIPHTEEDDILKDMLDYYESTGKTMRNKTAVLNRLNDLKKKLADEELKTQQLALLLNSDDMDAVITAAGYEIVEIPVLNHCDDKVLKEFL